MIPVTLLDIYIESDGPLDFGANPGSSLRGALYETLRALYDDGRGAYGSDDDANPVAWLLRMEDHGRQGGKDTPRPLALRPLLNNHVDTAMFSIALYGKGRAHLPMLVSALDGMGRVGIGRGRKRGHGRFAITQIQQRNPATGKAHPVMDRQGVQIGQLHPPPGAETYHIQAKSMAVGDTLTVRFLTPTRIIRKGGLCHVPDFSAWVRRLLARTIDIARAYTDEPAWIPLKELFPLAEDVVTVEDKTHWQEAWSGSRRTGNMQPTGGFVGEAIYRGTFDLLLPWLILGQSLQVGKHTVKGNGWYTLDTID